MERNQKKTNLIDLPPDDLKLVKSILKKHVSNYKVFLFGSRAQGTAKPYSDIDLCIMSEKPLGLKKMADLREAFKESDLPFKVDIVDWADTEEAFQKIIQEQAVEIQNPEKIP